MPGNGEATTGNLLDEITDAIANTNLVNVNVDYASVRDVLNEVNSRIERLQHQIAQITSDPFQEKIQKKMEEFNARFSAIESELKSLQESTSGAESEFQEELAKLISETKSDIATKTQQAIDQSSSHIKEEISLMVSNLQDQEKQKLSAFATIEQMESMKTFLTSQIIPPHTKRSPSTLGSAGPSSPRKKDFLPPEGLYGGDQKKKLSDAMSAISSLQDQMSKMQAKISSIEDGIPTQSRSEPLSVREPTLSNEFNERRLKDSLKSEITASIIEKIGGMSTQRSETDKQPQALSARIDDFPSSSARSDVASARFEAFEDRIVTLENAMSDVLKRMDFGGFRFQPIQSSIETHTQTETQTAEHLLKKESSRSNKDIANVEEVEINEVKPVAADIGVKPEIKISAPIQEQKSEVKTDIMIEAAPQQTEKLAESGRSTARHELEETVRSLSNQVVNLSNRFDLMQKCQQRETKVPENDTRVAENDKKVTDNDTKVAENDRIRKAESTKEERETISGPLFARLNQTVGYMDKQINNIKDAIPQMVTRSDLVRVLDSITIANSVPDPETTAAARSGYRCLLCGRPTSGVSGLITDTEVAKLIGQPMSYFPSKVAGASGQYVLSYSKDLQASQRPHSKKSTLPKITQRSERANSPNDAESSTRNAKEIAVQKMADG